MKIPNQKVFEGKTIQLHPRHVEFVDDRGRISQTITSLQFIGDGESRDREEGMDFMRCARAGNEVKHFATCARDIKVGCNKVTNKLRDGDARNH